MSYLDDLMDVASRVASVSLLEDEASVAQRPDPKIERIGLPFLPEDEAAEALVLDELAALCGRVSPLEACRLLFGPRAAMAGDGSDGDARARVSEGSSAA